MKILMITPTYYPKIGGIENHIKELSYYLSKNNHKVSIVVVNPNITDYKKSFLFGIETHYIKAIGRYPFIFFQNLNNFLKLKMYDIIHIHDPHLAGISFHFYYNKYNLPKILSTHGGIFHTNKFKSLKKVYWKTVAKLLIRQYSKVICVSKSDYEKYKSLTNNLEIIENGINVSKFSKIYSLFSKAPNKSFIYFGRFSKNKGIENLLKVFEILFKKDNEIKLTLVGKSETEEINKLLQCFQLKYPKNIKIYPFLDEDALLRILSQHKFFISATKYEGFGISILEAAASGRIVIVNNISPINKIFNKDEVFFVNFNNIEETVKNILNILSLSNLQFDKIRKKAFNKVKSYSWENTVQKIEKLYFEVINV